MKFKFLFVFLFLALLFFSSNTFSQILTGEFNCKELEKQPYVEWKSKNYNYNPDKKIIKKLKKSLKKNDIKITIVMGTWCSDSQLQVPRFLKILDDINFDYNNLIMIGVNREKQAETIDISKYLITRVPTFIFYSNEKEIGRITETPETTLENDFFNIISKI